MRPQNQSHRESPPRSWKWWTNGNVKFDSALLRWRAVSPRLWVPGRAANYLRRISPRFAQNAAMAANVRSFADFDTSLGETRLQVSATGIGYRNEASKLVRSS